MSKWFVRGWVCLSLLLMVGQAHASQEHIVKAPVSRLAEAESCMAAACHKRIHGEWRSSMHSRSTPAKDPLVKAFYRYLAGEGVDTKSCDKCHAPLKAIYSDEQQESRVFKEGVTCIFCHAIYGNHDKEGHGSDHYLMDLTRTGAGPGGITDEGKPGHDVEFISLFRTVDICAGCHQQGETDFIINNDRDVICQYCHMPSQQHRRAANISGKRDKVYRHLFEGGHSEMLLSMALIIDGYGSVDESNGVTTLTMNIENDAFHFIPAGFPLRAIYIKVEALDDNENVVWSNYQDDPYLESPDTYFGQVFAKEDELFAHHVKEVVPTRKQVLPAKATHTVTLEVPKNDVAMFHVRAYYRLVNKSAIEHLQLDESLAPEVLIFDEMLYVE